MIYRLDFVLLFITIFPLIDLVLVLYYFLFLLITMFMICFVFYQLILMIISTHILLLSIYIHILLLLLLILSIPIVIMERLVTTSSMNMVSSFLLHLNHVIIPDKLDLPFNHKYIVNDIDTILINHSSQLLLLFIPLQFIYHSL